LEWTTPIKPGHGNWEGDVPTVHRWPYDYSKPGSKYDFLPQTVADNDPEWFEGVPTITPVPERKTAKPEVVESHTEEAEA
jgi:hypothetical protein